MNPILVRALEHLNIINNSSAGMLAHPLDESRTKEMLNFLKAEGVELDHSEILEWGIAKGWKPSNAQELADLAERIGSGARVVIKHPGRLGDKIKAELRALK